MPQLQGYVNAAWQDMIDVFGQPERRRSGDGKVRVQWKLDGGTILHDYEDTAPAEQVTQWHIAGWSLAAVDQVIGRVARAGRFGHVGRARPATHREAVHITPAAVLDDPVGA